MRETKEKLKNDKAVRLVKARRFFGGYESARSVAVEKGWNYNNYKAHEAGINGFSEETARQYAAVFNVSLSWLISGEGLPQGGMDIVEVLESAVETAVAVLKVIKPEDPDLIRLIGNALNQLTRALEQSKKR